MGYGKALRIGVMAALGFWAPAVPASYAQSSEPDLAADVSQLFDWIDSELAEAAAASQPGSSPTPALGEGPVGQALGWLLSDDAHRSVAADSSEASAAQPEATQPSAAEGSEVTPVAAMAAVDGVPEDEPLRLTQQLRPTTTVLPQGLLLPVAAPQGLP